MKNNSHPIMLEMKQLFILALPLVLSSMVDASFNFTATLLSAHLGVQELAAGGLVTTLFITIMVFMWGVLIAISGLVSQFHGAKNDDGIARILKDGLILACIFSVPGMLLVWNMSPILLFFGQKQETIAIAQQYLHALTFAVFPDFIALIFLQLVIGLGRTKLALFFSGIKVPVTLIISAVLMYGKFGFPHLGIAGLGWGIAAGMWLATIWLLIYFFSQKDLRHYLFRHITAKGHYYGEILRVGLPMAGMFCIEVGFFTAMSLMMGRIDSHVLAANQIATQFTGFFTIVISFTYAQAVTIRIGNALGKKDLRGSMQTIHAALLMTLAVMFVVACCYWFLPKYLIGIDLDTHKADNQIIMHYATQFLLIAGFVQIFESTRIVLFGALRGLAQTRFSMMTSLVIFWLIAFPLGLLLTFVVNLGGVGMWLGMAIGTLTGAILLKWRLNKTLSVSQLV